MLVAEAGRNGREKGGLWDPKGERASTAAPTHEGGQALTFSCSILAASRLTGGVWLAEGGGRWRSVSCPAVASLSRSLSGSYHVGLPSWSVGSFLGLVVRLAASGPLAPPGSVLSDLILTLGGQGLGQERGFVPSM